MSVYKRTALRVSTMTATNNGLAFDRNKLMTLLPQILIPLWWPGEGIVKFEHSTDVIGESHRDALTNRKITNKSFFNQSTLVVRRAVGVAASLSAGGVMVSTAAAEPVGSMTPTKGFKEVNIKLFGNGSVQMTGINSEEFARETLEWLIAECAKLSESPFTKPPVVNKMNIQMINSDFSIGTPIQSEAIHAILRDRYNLFSIFEKTLYQGVDTKYFYNTERDPEAQVGVCDCPTLCSGQGDGHGPGQCKRITISIFQTGNIIITGARNMAQINEAYEFINRIFDAHESEIILPQPKTDDTMKTIKVRRTRAVVGTA